MSNCLITKLSGVIQNDSLMKLGELVFNVSSQRAGSTTTQQKTIHFLNSAASGPLSIRCSGNTSFTVSGQSYTTYEGSDFDVTFPDGEYDIYVRYPKYVGNTIEVRGVSKFFAVHVSQFKYHTFYWLALHNFYTYGEFLIANFDTMDGLMLSVWESPGSISYVNIDNFANNTRITNIRASRAAGTPTTTEVYGNVENLQSPKLTNLFLGNSKVRGDLSVMLTNMISNGVTNGSSVYVQASDSQITFKGVGWNSFLNSASGSGYGVRFTFNSSAADGYTYAKG